MGSDDPFGIYPILEQGIKGSRKNKKGKKKFKSNGKKKRNFLEEKKKER